MFETSSDVPVSRGSVVFGKAAFSLDRSVLQPVRDTADRPGFSAGQVLDPLFPTATTVQVDRGAEILEQGDKAEYCFQVVAGCVRTVRLLKDGRRQVGEFLLAGDVFGWETVGEHAFAAEAVTPVTLRRFRLSAVEELAERDRVFANTLRRYMADQVRIARGRLVLLGRKTASERIASFLVDMSERLGYPGTVVIDLPMSRADMADHLGLTIETVCRGLAELRRHERLLSSGHESRFAIAMPSGLPDLIGSTDLLSA